jgi:hypothetical protein
MGSRRVGTGMGWETRIRIVTRNMGNETLVAQLVRRT